jgi:hypothetical protein
MKFKIPDEVLKNAIKCNKLLSCIENDKHVLCQVKHCVDNKVHFIKCLHNNECDYKMSFGSSYYCSCPVRKEIYKKYKK